MVRKKSNRVHKKPYKCEAFLFKALWFLSKNTFIILVIYLFFTCNNKFKSLGLNTLSQRDWSFIKIINIDL